MHCEVAFERCLRNYSSLQRLASVKEQECVYLIYEFRWYRVFLRPDVFASGRFYIAENKIKEYINERTKQNLCTFRI